MIDWPKTHEDWCGPSFPLRDAVAGFLDKRALDVSDLQRPINLEVIEDWARSDQALIARWHGLLSLARFVVTEDLRDLNEAIAKLDEALQEDPQEKMACPRECTAVLDWVAGQSKGSTDKPLLSKSKPWTAASWIVYDLLSSWYCDRKLKGGPRPPSPVAIETTPILVASNVPGLRDNYDAVLDLCVELLPGPPGYQGLITPDFWAMGLVGFGKEVAPESSAEECPNFLEIIHDALRLAWSKPGRLRWRLKPRGPGRFPPVIAGPSVEAATACAAWAVSNQSGENPHSLLDTGVAITACLGPAGNELGKRPLAIVDPGTLRAKLNAALGAGLSTVLVAKGQVPPEWDRHPHKPARENEPSLLIEQVPDLAHAYDSLLITSAAIRSRKQAIVDRWNEQWIEEPTHEDFKNDRRRNS